MTLTAAFLALVAASLLHHVHNAQFFAQYPNLPAWITPPVVYLAWLGAAAVGTTGYLLVRRGHRRAGLGLLALYACYGLDALVHYALAPVSAHTVAMNATIGLEAVAAAALLALVLGKIGSVPIFPGRPSP
jgi:hypothetical protein